MRTIALVAAAVAALLPSASGETEADVLNLCPAFPARACPRYSAAAAAAHLSFFGSNGAARQQIAGAAVGDDDVFLLCGLSFRSWVKHVAL
jgi:hypothetical protein